MSNLNVTSGSTYITATTATAMSTGGPYPCAAHGVYNCSCLGSAGGFNTCSACGVNYNSYSLHQCTLSVPNNLFLAVCYNCGQRYSSGSLHTCYNGTSTVPYTWNTTTISGTNWIYPSFKDVKEITTDSELFYEWSGSSFDMKLPAKFSDCFLKVGFTWSPLYPLIFSALENDFKEISFHLVVGITDKTFEGDTVILKSVTTTKIEDNLTLMQLCSRTKEYFKDDKTN